MPRVVSLIASATEIVCALGFGDDLVGRSHECDFPPWVVRLPRVTEPKFPTGGTSREIDDRVKHVLREALSVYRVDADRLRELRPEVIVTQAHCEVCAVSTRDVEEAVCQWLGSRPTIVSLEPNRLEDVWAGIRQVAGALGSPARGERLVAELRARMAAVAERGAGLPGRPEVACLEWIEPLMAAGNWLPELVALAGGRDRFGVAGAHAPPMRWAELRAADPEVIVVSPCGFDLARTRSEMPALARQPGWPELRAVRGGRVCLADGSQFFNRPGPRLVETLEILAEILHPERFSFGHRGRAWGPWPR